MQLILNHDTPDDFVVSTMKTHSVREMIDYVFTKLGLDYTKRKKKFDMESINHLQVHATSLGGVLMTHLEQ